MNFYQQEINLCKEAIWNNQDLLIFHAYAAFTKNKNKDPKTLANSRNALC